tara:strand:+ start:524 stop:1297 length:774 start_codon:yes stop_codon:yes gene_type:complete
MINKGTVIRGKRWGKRLTERLRTPPLGISQWMRRHTDVVKDDASTLAGCLRISRRRRFLKLYRSRNLLFKLLCLARLARPMATFRTALVLAASEVPIPRPLSCVLVSEGLLMLSEGLDSSRDYCALWEAGQSGEELYRMMRGAALTLSVLHRAGYTHGDCKWRNLLWIDGECFMVDLDGARRRRLFAARARARDVARFTVSAEEAGVPSSLLQAFLDSYVAHSGVAREELLRRMQPNLEKLRGRHLEKYGITPQPLL